MTGSRKRDRGGEEGEGEEGWGGEGGVGARSAPRSYKGTRGAKGSGRGEMKQAKVQGVAARSARPYYCSISIVICTI